MTNARALCFYFVPLVVIRRYEGGVKTQNEEGNLLLMREEHQSIVDRSCRLLRAICTTSSSYTCIQTDWPCLLIIAYLNYVLKLSMHMKGSYQRNHDPSCALRCQVRSPSGPESHAGLLP